MKEDQKIVELTEFVVGLDEMTVKLNFNRLLDLYLLLTAKINLIDSSVLSCGEEITALANRHLQEKVAANRAIKKLEKLYNEVHLLHAHIVERNRTTGINVVRDNRAAAVNTDGFQALTTHAAVSSLLDSLLREGEIQSPQISNQTSNSSLIENTADFSDQTMQLESKVEVVPLRKAVSKGKKDDFRMGGLGRSRGRKAVFDMQKVRGMYDDCDEGLAVNGEDEQVIASVRRNGIVFIIPREGENAGHLCYVRDNVDNQLRACALRTLVDLQGALSGLGIRTEGSDPITHSCSYVIGARKQKWAMLGGEVEGLSGETAIAVRLTVASSPSDIEHNVTVNEASQSTSPDLRQYDAPPIGSFRRHCNVCKHPYVQIHRFYHQLCGRCGDFNLEKRLQTALLSGCLCLVTGGRVRIGYQICLKLLRAGASVIATTRWPADAALRYSHEQDFHVWRGRLRIDELEMSDPIKVEEYCDRLLNGSNGIEKIVRLHVLINNAAQTITRPSNWFVQMRQMEQQALPLLTTSAFSLINNGNQISNNQPWKDDVENQSSASRSDGNKRVFLDESGQPLDLSGVNSWSRRLADVSNEELIHTMNVNAIAPFILMRKLKNVLTPKINENSNQAGRNSEEIDKQHEKFVSNSLSSSSQIDIIHKVENSQPNPAWRSGSIVVNVTALEGKFNVGKKSSGHPHTNMAKAALNMLTLTCAREWARTSIYVSSVDTGWVTDMAPGGVGASSLAHETFIGPPLDDEDGAARVLDPAFTFSNSDGQIKMFGHFYKDYMKASW